MYRDRATIRNGIEGNVAEWGDSSVTSRNDRSPRDGLKNQGKEFTRLTNLKCQTIVRHGDKSEIEEAKNKMAEITGKGTAKGTKRRNGGNKQGQ